MNTSQDTVLTLIVHLCTLIDKHIAPLPEAGCHIDFFMRNTVLGDRDWKGGNSLSKGQEEGCEGITAGGGGERVSKLRLGLQEGAASEDSQQGEHSPRGRPALGTGGWWELVAGVVCSLQGPCLPVLGGSGDLAGMGSLTVWFLHAPVASQGPGA